MNVPTVFDLLRILVLRFGILTAVTCNPLPAVAGDPITAIALVPGGESVITGSHGGLFVRSGLQFKDARQLACEVESIHDVRFSPDGKRLAVAGGTHGQFGLIEILDWPGTMEVSRIRQHEDVVYSVNWSPDGKWLGTASLDGRCLICDSVSGMPLRQIEGHSKGLTGVEWLTSPPRQDADSTARIITCSLDQTIRVWSVDLSAGGSSPVLVRTMDQHTGAIMGIALQPGAKMHSAPVLASWGEDRTVRFWQPDNGRLLRFARLQGMVASAAWSADGSELLAAMESGAITKISTAKARVMEIGRTDRRITALALSGHPHRVISGDGAGIFAEISILLDSVP